MLSGAGDGDVGLRCEDPPELLRARRDLVAPGPWRYARQCHGDGVVVLGPAEPCQGREADALVSSLPGAPLAVFSADCALIGLASPEGVVGAVHAGWRGLLAGVIERAATAMSALGASHPVAVVGPLIGPECYEFGAAELAALRARYGDTVVAETASGHPALDLRAGVHRALEAAGAELALDSGLCTACDPGFFSWRARGERARQCLVVTAA